MRRCTGTGGDSLCKWIIYPYEEVTSKRAWCVILSKKDYSLFLPMDSITQTALLSGYIYIEHCPLRINSDPN